MLGISSTYLDDNIIEELSRQVYQELGTPTSKYAVAIQLELMGITDQKLRHNFQNVTLFDLSAKIYKRILEIVEEENKEDPPVYEKGLAVGSVWGRFAAFVKYYGAGLMFMAPMFSQILSVVFITYSLWAWLYFNELQATVVALGTIVAFIATGGVTLSAGREVSYYMGQENYYLSYKVSQSILGIGFLLLIGTGLLVYAINVLIPFYPHQLIILSGTYMLFIGMWVLSSTILYALQKNFMILVSVLVGTLILVLGMEYFDFGIYLSHWIGMTTSSLIMIIYGFIFFKYKISKHENNTQQHLPKFEVKYYNNYRYFIYGTCYFLFLFIDRIMAWSTGTPPPPYVIWFNTSYELGMDWALMSLVLTVAMLEYSVNRFSSLILPFQKHTDIKYRPNFRNFFQNYYVRQIFLLTVVGVLSIFASYFLVTSFRGMSGEVQLVEDFFSSPILYKVFWLASVGYWFMSFGLLNTLFFFTLGRPEKVVKSMLIAIAVNAVVGFVCSRVISYEYAVLGLVAGGFTFAALTVYYSRKFFNELHYNYYSAF